MTRVEKQFNKDELRGYKNCDNGIYSMLPGIQSDSPQKHLSSTPVIREHRLARPKRHLCAPPLLTDNTISNTVEIDLQGKVAPFKRGSDLFGGASTFLGNKPDRL